MVVDEPTRALIEELKEDSTLIRYLAEDFSNCVKDMKILTCYELLETPTMEYMDGKWKRTGPPAIMVNQHSACLHFTNEVRLPIQANHSMMAKLSDNLGSEYHSIRDHLASYVSQAPAAIERRQLKQQCEVALVEAFTLADFVNALVCIVKKQDFECFKKQMGDELGFLEAFGGFLVDDELNRILTNTDLSAKYSRRICELLKRLKTTFASFANLAAKYHEPYRNVVHHGFFADQQGLRNRRTDSLDVKLFQDPEMSESLFQAKSLDAILQQCTRSTQGLGATMSFAMLCSIRSERDFEDFQAKPSMQQVDLARFVKRQRLVRYAETRELQPLRGRLEGIVATKGASTSDLQTARFYQVGKTHGETVIVEYRRHEPPPLDETASGYSDQIAYLGTIKKRMRTLAGMLHDLSAEDQDDARGTDESRSSRCLNCFPCLGFLEQEDRFQFAFLFQIPEGLSVKALEGFKSLSSYIEKFKIPELERRFSLAYEICRAVLNIHSCGWVHKSIRSSNVILVPDNTAKPTYRPYLKGFEISRGEKGPTSLRADFDFRKDLYRHPERQGAPTERFKKKHDLYAVGVVMLEIGRWRSMPTYFKDDIESARQGKGYPGAHNVKKQILSIAETHLPASMGTKYAQAVSKCIKGFDIPVDDEEQTRLGLAFSEEVLDILEAGVVL